VIPKQAIQSNHPAALAITRGTPPSNRLGGASHPCALTGASSRGDCAPYDY